MIPETRKFRVATSKRQRKSNKSFTIIFPAYQYEKITGHFKTQQEQNFEGYAIALCGLKTDPSENTHTYLVKKIFIPEKGDLIEHSSVSVTPSGEFLEKVLAEASESNSAVIEVHTHVDAPAPSFSSVDLENGMENGRFLKSCKIKFCMVVLGSEGLSVLEYDGDSDTLKLPEKATITVLTRHGLKKVLPLQDQTETTPEGEAYDRQIRLWGSENQRRISEATVGIVGLGGTGAIVMQILSRIGVKKFILVDPDTIEESNLSRLPYAGSTDVGKKKVKVAAAHLKKVNKNEEITTFPGPVSEFKDKLKSCTVIFGCVDNDLARLTLNEISLRYFIPLIDTGTEIFVANGNIEEMGGQVRLVVPAVTGCLECGGLIDRDEAAINLLGREELNIMARAGYVRGTNMTPAPAVMTLNSIVASMAVQEFADMMTERSRPEYSYLIYNARSPGIDQLSLTRSETCPLCGERGILGAGDIKKQSKTGFKIIGEEQATP
ncbi:HesA/MoeB/ThiF family protein [Methanocella sp. MCL-LM]|uniref:HesA/MoeB/ThiF family protein n=1 Tax=Methanocella sp. MCL-LM TaxID=3412035 RepID=UPI003C752568